MIDYNQIVMLGSDMAAYVQYEAQRRQIPVEAVIEEEIAARRLAEKEALTADELKSLAATSAPPPGFLEDDEECPF
jgi:hypothetical protein